MSKGTPSMGRRQKTTHIRCRRCGRNAYHKQKSVCASCGYGASSKMRGYSLVKEDPPSQSLNLPVGQGQVLAPVGRHEGVSCAASLASLDAPACT